MLQSMSAPRMALPKVHGACVDKERQEAAQLSIKCEIKSGKLRLLHKLGGKAAWLPVFVRVYKSAFEHFAVVSRDQVISTFSTYVNLRATSCGVEGGNSDTQFKVIPNNYEGTVIRFDTGDSASVPSWVQAFSSTTPPPSPTLGWVSPTLSPAIPRSPVLPTLPEMDEEE